MRNALLLLGALTFGCDDPEVSARAATILEHGIVAAQADCSMESTNSLGEPAVMKMQAVRFIDGSAMVTASSAGVNNTRFFARDSADLESLTTKMYLNFAATVRIEMSFDAGDVKVYEPTASPSDTPDTCAVATCCTGFNLEAFGAE